ncbi:MAG: arginine--tRNA ligase [Myxococcota bacterium]|nr:arginine--tRNA ligase [Myxococcota bacterium]
MPTHYTPLHVAAAEAVATRAGIAATDLKVEMPPKAEMGDLAVACHAIAKAQKKNPVEVAAAIAAGFTPTGMLASASAAGPFVNFKIDRAQAFAWIIDAALRDRLVPGDVGTDKTICIDYSSPNISKHLAYHHVRGTTLGHALAQIYRALGYRVVGINFLGDWGTTHGMLLAAWNLWGPVEPLDVAALNALYVRFNEASKENPELKEQGRAWFKRLEAGDADARALWQRFRDVSWLEFESVYDILGIKFEEVRGESAYEPDLPRVLKELAPLIVESDGAQVVQLEGEKTPILLVKNDGSTLYATRDVAAAQYRWESYHFTRSLYVVGREQSLHFRQLFKLLAKAGHEWAARCEHVPYGHVRIGGKKTATRLGNVVMMRTVFDIMQDEVRPMIVKSNPEMPADQVDRVAREVGIGAVIFANLASQREKDVDFDLEKVTSISGDSGPYLQYSHARCASILRRAGATGDSLDGVDFSLLTHEAEWGVAKRLLELPEMVVRAGEAAEPHIVCHYLLQLASDFSRWYTIGNGDKSLRVINDDAELQRARLALTAGVKAALATGLRLLGMAAPDQM